MSNLNDNETEVNEFENENEEPREMGFWDHLGELRVRLFYATLGLLLGCIVAGIYIDNIMEGILLKPAIDAHLELQNLRVFGKPMLYFKVIMIVGVILSFPFSLYQIWKFIEPALYNNEKGWAKRISFFTSLCFFCGVLFAYKVMIPSMLQFSVSFGTDKIKNLIDINEYWGFIMLMILSAGIFFEMPMISFVLTRFGLLSPRFLRKYRRHSIILILILAAVITPSPDPFNQMIVAVPIYVLYEISIFVSQFTLKKHFS